MVLCFALGCNHKSTKNDCSFFRFPKNPKKYAVWTRMAKRYGRVPDKNARLCSCHFVDGNKENNPAIFDYNKEKLIDLPNHTEKKKQRAVSEIVTREEKRLSIEDNKHLELICLKAENEQLKGEISRLELLLADKNGKFKFSQICENEKFVVMYTGLPNKHVFFSILNYINRLQFNYAFKWKIDSLSLEDQLFITLQKLRQNYTFLDLGVRYSVSETTVRNIFFTFLHVLHESIYKTFMEGNIPSLTKIQNSIQNSDFPNCRFLIDSTEIYIENPRHDLEAQRQTYSHYKKRQTFKGLLAVAPNGVICFVSKLWPGSTSDKIIFKECGIIKILEPGDLILADKGFLIHDLLPQGVSLNVPPFLFNSQFTESEAKFTTKLARTRVHVERAIQRIKNYEILDNIPHHFTQSATVIFQVCAALVNLQNPVLKR